MTMLSDGVRTTRAYKGAVLLASLGTELAAQVLSKMDDRQVEALVKEMARLGPVWSAERDLVVSEFQRHLAENPGVAFGGLDYARKMLEQAMGQERASQMLGGLAPQQANGPSLGAILETTSPGSLAALVADEHPQVIAMLVSQLSVEDAAAMLAALPAQIQGPVAVRLAELEAPSTMALEALERCLVEKLRGDRDAPRERRGTEGAPVAATESAGPRRVAEILSRMRRSVEKMLLSSLEEQAPGVAQRVNRYRFGFEHLLQLDSRSIQRILREVDSETLRLAMKGLDVQQQEVIYANISERAASQLKEDLETAAPVRLREVEAAQQTIVSVARHLRDAGDIQFGAGDGPEEEEEPYV